MFSWFGPHCPCDPSAKQWVEERLQWLTKQFGLHILLERPVILPAAEFFPGRWDGTPEAAREMILRVCGHMGVDPTRVKLRFFTNKTPEHMGGEAGFAVGTWSTGGGGGGSDRFSLGEYGGSVRTASGRGRICTGRPTFPCRCWHTPWLTSHGIATKPGLLGPAICAGRRGRNSRWR
jgi:hypothetical protein